MKLMLLDTETGGTDPIKSALLSIGAVVTNDRLELLDEFEVFIRPVSGLAFTKEAANVNKLTIPFLERSGVFERAALLAFNKWSNKHGSGHQAPIITGWHLHFDIAFMKAAYIRQDLGWHFGYRTLDVQSLWAYANIFTNKVMSFGGLTQAARTIFGRSVPHGAKADCLLVLDILRHFVFGEDK